MNSDVDKLKMELEKTIKLLTQMLEELEAIYADPPGPSEAEEDEQKRKIHDIILYEIKPMILKLQNILAEISASEVVIPGVTPEAAAALNAEIEKLNQEIQKEKYFNKILQAAIDILDAVNKVISMAPK